MASTEISTSSNHFSSAASEEAAKRSTDEAFIDKMKTLVERLRRESATLKKSLELERSGLRALKAQHEATLRQTKTESKKREEALEQQLRSQPISGKQTDTQPAGPAVKRLCSEIQSLKAINRSLQEKLKVATETERERAGELRAQATRHAAAELALQKDTRSQVHKLLEEIKSKDRMIAQLRRSTTQPHPDHTQVHRMESGTSELRKLHFDQGKEASDRDDLKTDIRHRKETFYREAASDGDSAVSSAPSSLSPQPLVDMWACTQCRAASERAESSARECTRLADALRDARDQLELLEFRLLELEDAAPDKGARESLTDSDSGCVSPGSRLKDSASPELRRLDSGYKSPGGSPAAPRRLSAAAAHSGCSDPGYKSPGGSPASPRRLSTSSAAAHHSGCSDSGDSYKGSSVREQLELMLAGAGSAEDRACLEQLLTLMYGLGDVCQIKPNRLCDIKSLSKLDVEDSCLKPNKVIATISPYSQSRRLYTCESLESLCSDEPKKTCILQESGIFEEVETENKTTQTEGCDSLECGDLNTEIQRLNSIREKLEKRGVTGNKSLNRLQSEEEGLECRCVKLGARHKQYYERRLKFLEGKISIYEAAQDVKKAKLAERLQKEFTLENRIQELESQLSTLQEKYEQLEEDCCELEEIENDTRLHAQQLETDYELATAQLRDMSEQRECSRAQAERLSRELRARETALNSRAAELRTRLTQLEKALPALIAWNVLRALGTPVPCMGQLVITKHLGVLAPDPKAALERMRAQSSRRLPCHAATAWREITAGSPSDLQKKLAQLEDEKSAIEAKATKQKAEMEKQFEGLKSQLRAQEEANQKKLDMVQAKIQHLEAQIEQKCSEATQKVDPATAKRLHSLIQSEVELQGRVRELERREAAYLEMLTQADDMWAEMEDGYKKRITSATQQTSELTLERDKLKKSFGSAKKRVLELEQSESSLRVSLEKAERDSQHAHARTTALDKRLAELTADLESSQDAFAQLSTKYKKEIDCFRQRSMKMNQQLNREKDAGRDAETAFSAELEKVKKDLSRTCKNTMDLEVTNSELREEVESLESQLALMQKTIAQCKRKYEDQIKEIGHELSIKTEELEELRSEIMRKSLRPSVQEELRAEKTEYIDDCGYTTCTAVPQKAFDYNRMHHSLSFIASDIRCSCPSMRSRLVGSLIEDLFERAHNTTDDDLAKLCVDIAPPSNGTSADCKTKARITNYLLMAISKELVRSIGDADAKTDTEEWQRAASSAACAGDAGAAAAVAGAGGSAAVLGGAERLASVACACAAARLAAARADLANVVNTCQGEVLEHSDVKIMEEQLASAIESIVNCPSCALGTNAIVWSTDV